jgi:hypothetical protein
MEATDFRSNPYVCGAIGRVDEQVLERLRERSPAPLREVHRSQTAVLLASSTIAAWRSGDDHGFFWVPMADGAEPTSWQSAAERRVAAGLVETSGKTVLHADAMGMQDLYTRRIGAALYFSVRIDPLLRLDGTKLHIDWTAWASILAFTSPLGKRTPFAEVQRVTAASAWLADERELQRTGFEPSWLSTEPEGNVSAADIVATVDACVPTTEDLAVTLSGGWDSRLLAILSRRHTDHLIGWTTSEHDGRDRDLRFAPAVAEALDIEHHTVVPESGAWLDELSPARRRFDYQCTLHTWLMPLARVLHQRQGRFIDGLAGDVLFKSLFAGPELVAAGDADERHQLLWKSLSQSRLKDPSRLAPGVAADFERRSRESMVESVHRFDGHPAAATLGILHTRTSRSIAQGPFRLLAPELSVNVPFVHPQVIEAALRVPPQDKLGGVFYREMLSAADPVVARLPSTNDGGPKGKRGSNRKNSPRNLRGLARSIRSSEPVVGLLGTEFREALDDDDALMRFGGSLRGHRQLNWASLLAEWRATYADVLADDDGPT